MTRTASEEIREIWASSGMTYKEISKITGIKENSLACWITGRRNPPEYVVEYLRLKLKTAVIKNNADYIRQLNNNDLANLLELVRSFGFGDKTASQFLEDADLIERQET